MKAKVSSLILTGALLFQAVISCSERNGERSNCNEKKIPAAKLVIPKDTLYRCIKETAALFAENNTTVAAVQRIFAERSHVYKIVSGYNNDSIDYNNLMYSVISNDVDSFAAERLDLCIPDSLQGSILLNDFAKLFGHMQKPSPAYLIRKESFYNYFYHQVPGQKRVAVTVVTSFPYNSRQNKVFRVFIQKAADGG